jgi:lipoprotein-anchoring transpeptidase ErfK/SrfK
MLLAIMAGTSPVFAQDTPEARTPPTPVEQPGAPTESTQPPEKAILPPIAIEIDLTAQKAWLLQDGKRVYETPICSGRTGHETPAGDFSVLEKDLDHKSTMYGRIVDQNGRVLISDADGDMALPAGGKFVRAPMKHFMRFEGAVGMHAGRLPGYPASHGCVRLPAAKAALFYNIAEVGTPVRVFGKAPRTGTSSKPRKPIAEPVPATPVPATPKPGWLTRLFTKPSSAQPGTPVAR